MTIVSPDEFEKTLYLGPVWVPSTEAARLLGLTKSGMHETPIKRGIVRAMRDPSTGHTLILRDDLVYVYRRRSGATNERRQGSYETLVDRGVFPPACEGLNAYDLVKWAQAHAPEKLLSALSAPSTMVVGTTPQGTEVRELLTLEGMANRLDRQERMLEALLALQGVETRYGRLSDQECLSLLRDVKAIRGERFEPPEMMRRSRMLLRISAEHLAQLRSWQLLHKGEAENILNEHELPYVCLLDLAHDLETQSRGLPGSNLRLSLHNRIHVQCEKAYTHIMNLVRAQVSVDLLLYRQDHGGYLPAPLCETDRFILSEILPTTSLFDGT